MPTGVLYKARLVFFGNHITKVETSQKKKKKEELDVLDNGGYDRVTGTAGFTT